MTISKMLQSAGHYDKVLKVIERIFQRNPHMVTEMTAVVEEEGGGLLVRKRRLIELATENINEVCSNADVSLRTGLPNKLSNYIAFLELVLLRIKADSDIGSKQWQVHILLDYPPRNDEPQPMDEEGFRLRKKLKLELKTAGYLENVQTEVDNDRIWMRVAITKRSKDKFKDKARLEKAKAVFIVYYPGEPYFYAVKSISDVITDALVSALGCQGQRRIDLTGKSVGSLRRIRLGRDARDGPSVKARTNQDRFSVFDDRDHLDQEPPSHPKLDAVTLNITKNLDEEGTKLSCRIEIVGDDVIGGLEDMVQEGVISYPPPDWVANLSTAGRNKFRLKTGRARGGGGNIGGDRQMDELSVISRATTVL